MPGKYDMTVWRGNSYEVSFTMKDADDVAVDLTGRTLVFRAEWAGGSYRLDTDATGTGGDLVLTTPSAGLATLTMEPATTRQFAVGDRVVYEIEMQDGADEFTLLCGRIIGIGGVNEDA